MAFQALLNVVLWVAVPLTYSVAVLVEASYVAARWVHVFNEAAEPE